MPRRPGASSHPFFGSRILALALALPGAAPAQQAADMRFERVDAEPRLAQKQIRCSLQDRRGFLWFCTNDGLARYDGYGAVLFQPAPAEGLAAHHDVLAIVEGRDGSLWVGTDGGGLDRLDPETGTFTHFHHHPSDPASLSSDRVAALHEDGAGNLWVGTDGGGLNRLDPEAGTFARYRHDSADPTSLSHDSVYSIRSDASGTVWIGTGGGLDRFDAAGGSFTRYAHDPGDPKLGHGRVFAILPISPEELWIGTYGGGLGRFDVEHGTFKSYRIDPTATSPAATSPGINRVRALHLDAAAQAFWIGTEGGGLTRQDLATGEVRHFRHSAGDPYSLSDDRVTSILQDRSGILWIGTLVGLNKLNPLTVPFEHYRPDVLDPGSLSDHRVRSVLEDRAGTLWVGTANGLNRLAPGAGGFVRYHHRPDAPDSLSDNHVSAIWEDHDGTLWLGTPYAGLNRLERAAGTFEHFRHDPANERSLSSDDVVAIYEDGAHRLWIGTWEGGLNRLDRARGVFDRYRHDPADPASLAGDRPFTLAGARAGGLWIGTWASGLDLLDPDRGTFTHHRRDAADPGGLVNDRIRALYEDEAGRLWIGTDGSGLAERDPRSGSFRHHTTGELPRDRVLGVLPDDAGYLWLATGHGLSRFDPHSATFESFDKTDGLQSNEFNLHAANRGRRGELFFGGNGGLTAFFPARVRHNEHVPPIALTALSVLGREVERRGAFTAARPLELAHDETVISCEFAALDFAAPARNRYAYKLEALQRDWVELGTRREVTLTHLAPGDYTLRVRGSNNHGRWNEEGLAIAIRVDPPWWASWWFRTVAAAAAVTLAFGAYKARTRRIRERNRALQREIDQRRAVEQERERLIAELEAKNAELERFTYTVSHDLKSPLLTIKGFLGWLQRDADAGDRERLGRDVAYIRDAATTMHRLLDELLELSRVGRVINPSEHVDLGELAREAADLVGAAIAERGVEVVIAPAMPVVYGDRVRLLEVLQNLVENAVKFMGEAPAPRVEIGAGRRGGEVVCHVRDNGLGIAPTYHEKIFGLFDRLHPEIEGTGIGLALVKRIVEVHGGRIWVESEGEGRGSTFFFTLPA
ncbi:MAG TPA: two-component regulator propeller domain-containing protein [Thermoanaerobaculia bacterium]